MNIQRLKFAWARGARVEVQLKTGKKAWVDAHVDRKRYLYVNPNYTFRIHPKDEHLQYGPLSSALIDSAMYGASSLGVAAYECATVMYADYEATGDFDTWTFFYLFAAELLADEGL